MTQQIAAFRRAVLLALATIVLVAGLFAGVLLLVAPPPPPLGVAVLPPVGPPLTRHLAFVIVDGLRYDVGTDPALMPELSRRMREQSSASAEIWAGPVSMTSSAILTYATGQRGDVDQIINNETGSPVAYSSLPKIARDAGLVTACTGDRAWFRMFPGVWSMEHPDPRGVAIDVDYNAEIFEATYAFLRASPRPNLLVAHFVTPDHQAHAYGVLSARYRAHIRAFDRSLHELLLAIPEDTTVIVTSDHGATDTGTHGSDTPLQRRSPLFAYGPGITPGRREARALDQIDVPSTLAALLGISAPAHARGHPLVDWLDVPDDERARIACADLERLAAYVRAAASPDAFEGLGVEEACAADSPRARIEGARRVAGELDRRLGRAAATGVPFGWLVPLVAPFVAGLIALAAIGRRSLRSGGAVLRGALLAAGVVALGLSLTYAIELLPGAWPNAVRIALYTIAGAALLAVIVRARACAGWLDRNVALGVSAVPGLLIVTPTRTTQAEAFVLAAVISGVALGGRGRAGIFSSSWDPPRKRASAHLSTAVIALLIAALAPIAFLETIVWPAWLRAEPAAPAFASFAILLLGIERGSRASMRGEAHAWTGVALGVAVAIASLLLRRTAPATLCLAGWIGLPLFALLAWRRGLRALAELLIFGSYAWVSRDGEVPILAATLLVASAFGHALAPRLRGTQVRPSVVVAIVTFLFAWAFLQRIGVQLGVDFTQLDWGAGAFRDPDASLFRIGAALAYKHSFARAALLFAVLSVLPPAHRSWTARGLLCVEILRAAVLVAMLYVCGASFWTSLRVIGDLPHALGAAVIASFTVVVTARAEIVPGGEGLPRSQKSVIDHVLSETHAGSTTERSHRRIALSVHSGVPQGSLERPLLHGPLASADAAALRDAPGRAPHGLPGGCRCFAPHAEDEPR